MHRDGPTDIRFSDPTQVFYHRYTVDLASETVSFGDVRCQNVEDVLGGFGRSFQILATRDITDAFSENNPLIVNTGILTGTNVMTGLRTYFSAYSPLKVSGRGLPAAMWSAGSGKFGSKLKWSGVDEIVVERQASRPLVLVIRATDDGPTAGLEPADDLLGLSCYKKILALHTRYRYGHFAVIGPAGEHYQQCYFASVALSTENLLKSGDDKCRWAGRGGMGSIMGAKNLIGIVAECPDHVTSPALEIRALNKEIATGPGSRKFREANRGGLGGTWANYEPLDRFSFVPELNFRPQPGDRARKMYRTTVEPEFVITHPGRARRHISSQVRLRATQSAVNKHRRRRSTQSLAARVARRPTRNGCHLTRHYNRVCARLQRTSP